MRRLIVVCVAAFAAAACGLPFGIGLPSTSELINGATDSLSKASGFEVAGSFTSGTDTYKIDIQYLSTGAAHMDVTVGTTHVELIQVNGKVYYHGKEAAASFVGTDTFGQAQPTAVGTKWFTTSKATPIDMSGFTDASKVKANFLSTVSVSRKDGVSINGVDTAELSDSDSILNITESSPHQLVRLRTQSGKTVSGVTNGDLAFTNYNKAFAITEPAGALNLDDPTTFPPYYEVTNIDLSKCTTDPCTVAATVQNKGGTQGASASSTVTFTLTNDADSSVVGTCKATVSPDIANGQSVTVSCTITGGTWTTFVNNAAAGATFHGKAVPDNPGYD
jgi:hypothetical protein